MKSILVLFVLAIAVQSRASTGYECQVSVDAGFGEAAPVAEGATAKTEIMDCEAALQKYGVRSKTVSLCGSVIEPSSRGQLWQRYTQECYDSKSRVARFRYAVRNAAFIIWGPRVIGW